MKRAARRLTARRPLKSAKGVTTGPRLAASDWGYLQHVGYLIFDATDDAILAQCELLEDVLAIVEQLQEEQPQRELSCARFDDHRGELVSAQSLVRARGLGASEGFALYGRRGWRRR